MGNILSISLDIALPVFTHDVFLSSPIVFSSFPPAVAHPLAPARTVFVFSFSPLIGAVSGRSHQVAVSNPAFLPDLLVRVPFTPDSLCKPSVTWILLAPPRTR